MVTPVNHSFCSIVPLSLGGHTWTIIGSIFRRSFLEWSNPYIILLRFSFPQGKISNFITVNQNGFSRVERHAINSRANLHPKVHFVQYSSQKIFTTASSHISPFSNCAATSPLSAQFHQHTRSWYRTPCRQDGQQETPQFLPAAGEVRRGHIRYCEYKSGILRSK